MARVISTTWDAAAFEAGLRELLRGFPFVRLRVVGTCMEPAVPEGSTVTLESAERTRPRFGDVVVASHAQGLRLHRLVWAPSRAGRAWRTQADRALFFDARVRREDVLATVVSVDGEPVSSRRGWRAAASLLRSLLGSLRLRAIGAAAD